MSKKFDIAIVGATGVVGESMLEILSERNFPVGKIYALASERSLGKTVSFGHRELQVENLAAASSWTIPPGFATTTIFRSLCPK
jgi:aspartate-semialdehyde dehydrogenase